MRRLSPVPLPAPSPHSLQIDRRSAPGWPGKKLVSLDRVGLMDGEQYVLKFFYAERHSNSANCRIQTNFLLRNTGALSVSSAFD